MNQEDDMIHSSYNKLNMKSPKRLRTAFTPDQRKILELSFKRNSLPSSHELEDIAQKLGFKLKIVRTWFQNKRTQARKKLNKFPNRDLNSSMNYSMVPANLSESMKMVAPPNVSLNPIPTQLPFKITSAFNQNSSPLFPSRSLWNPFLYEPPRAPAATPPAPSSYNNYPWPSYYPPPSCINTPGNSSAMGPDYSTIQPMTPNSFSAGPHYQDPSLYSPVDSPYSTPAMNPMYSQMNNSRDNFLSYGVSSSPSMPDMGPYYAPSSRVQSSPYYAAPNADQNQYSYFSDSTVSSSNSGTNVSISPGNYSNYQWDTTPA